MMLLKMLCFKLRLPNITAYLIRSNMQCSVNTISSISTLLIQIKVKKNISRFNASNQINLKINKTIEEHVT